MQLITSAILRINFLFYVGILSHFLLPKTIYSRISFEQVAGLYEATKDDYKQYSLVWAMVALESNLLQNIRFF